MLRILVISLLVANLLLLGFKSSKPATQPKTLEKQTVVEDSRIPTIYLFSEIMENRDLMSGNRRCFSLGPFHSTEDAADVYTRLLDVSVSISERETQALVEKGYWVFMPPYSSLVEANRALLTLQALGLEDIGVIYEGEWANAVSLGYFLRQENALRRKKGLEERGHTPLIRVRRHSEPRYWLDYEQDPGSELIALDMQNRPNDFMQRALPCPEQSMFNIAGADPTPRDKNLAQAQFTEEDIEGQVGEESGTDVEQNTEGLPDGNPDSDTPETVETIPAGPDEQESDAFDGLESGQGTEIADDSGTGTGSGEA
ncbi:MAG: hypothetical protein GY732_14135 [Gammaproteobacteria bacterium]|nr:hypothetical protein [Gammaproteobacteria bacterium]